MCAGGGQLLKQNADKLIYASVKWQMQMCRWKSTSQRHLQLLKKKLNFLWGLQDSVDWFPRNATLSNEMPILKNWGKVAMWVWAGPTLSHEMRLDPRKLPKMQFCVALQCFDRQNCGEIMVRWKKTVKLTCCLRSQNPLAQNAPRSKGEILVLHLLAELFRAELVCTSICV